MQQILDKALEEGRKKIKFGNTATYIPELGTVDKNYLGICIYTRDGKCYKSGDADVRFTIQSISKVISLAVALECFGHEKIFERVGMEPSGDSFNSLIKLDLDNDHPYNPMINSGAIAITSYLVSAVSFEKMLEISRKLCLGDLFSAYCCDAEHKDPHPGCVSGCLFSASDPDAGCAV